MTGFVILHYLVEDITKQCVDGLLELFSHEDIVIAVVDNASPNGSGQALCAYYQNNDKVHVLCNRENLGFARGNNVGYDYLLAHYTPDFMVVMNNDVMIYQKDFIQKISCLHNKTGFAVLGPDIYCPLTKTHQNPSRLFGLTLAQVHSLVADLQYRSEHYTLWNCKNRIKQFLRPKKAKFGHQQNINWENSYDDPVLHGACYIFSKDYLQTRSYCFYPETFLYCEEDILFYQCRQAGLKMHYSPELQVHHLEDMSTNAAQKSPRRKAKAKIAQTLESAQLLLKLYEQGETHNDP